MPSQCHSVGLSDLKWLSQQVWASQPQVILEIDWHSVTFSDMQWHSVLQGLKGPAVGFFTVAAVHQIYEFLDFNPWRAALCSEGTFGEPDLIFWLDCSLGQACFFPCAEWFLAQNQPIIWKWSDLSHVQQILCVRAPSQFLMDKHIYEFLRIWPVTTPSLPHPPANP